jgi:Mrp family chromosome partitioning ATPase
VVLGAMVDEVVIVARAGSTDGDALRYAREQLEYVRAPLIGVLLNAVDFVKDAAFDAAYRFHARSHDYLMPNRER